MDRAVAELAVEAAFLAIAKPTLDQIISLPEVKQLVSTEDPNQYEFGNAAAVQGNRVVGWHVTDNPEAMIKQLRKTNFVKSYGPRGQHAELGPGFYVSAVPSFWVGRSRSKWEFLDRLSKDDLQRLIKSLRDEVDKQREMKRISDGEYQRAVRDLGYIEQGKIDPSVLTFLASQPYVIQFWKPQWLKRIGIEGAAPRAIKVQLLGTYAKLDGRPTASGLRAMRAAGLAGVFTGSGFSTNPELAVFHGKFLRVMGIEDV